jgi:hypothetical protein
MMGVNQRGTLGAWLGHPATVIALLVLVVNDHLLKAALPGLVTGKLSDAAGLVLAPPLLALVVRRPAAAMWSVAVGFSLVKSFGYAAELASGLWGVVGGPSLVRADPSDLLMLPFLGVAWWACRSVRSADRPAAAPWVRALRMAVLLPLALGAVAATSPAPRILAVNVVSSPKGIYLASEGADAAVSVDDGSTWKTTTDAVSTAAPQRQACSKADKKICFRVLDGTIGAQRSADGGQTWTTDWRVSGEDRRTLSRAYPNVGAIDTDLVSTAVAVADTADGGHVVVLANRRDGFALRDVDGAWTRIGFPEVSTQNVPALGDKRVEEVAFPFVALGTLVLLLIALVVGGAAAVARARWWAGVALILIGCPALMVMAYAGLDPDTYMFYPFLLISPVASAIACVAVAAGATSGVVGDGGRRRGRWAAVAWVAAVLAGGVGAGLWFLAVPVWAQIAADAVAVVAGIVLAGRVAAKLPPPEPLTTPPVPVAGWRAR